MKHLWKRWKTIALCLVAGQFAAAQTLRANEDTGLIGATLATVEKSHDLFTFFNLARMGSESLPDHTVVTYQPTAPTFRALVTLYITTDARGTIEQMRLEVARSFIDDAQQGIFAADLIKSLLAGVGNAFGKDDIAALASEIHARSMLNPGQTLITAQPTPVLSKQPSAAYLAYAGKGPAQTLANQAGTVKASLENKDEDGTATLEIILAAVRR